MTCCSYVVIHVRITTSAGICCITLIFTSRSCYFCLMSMTCCRDGLCCGLATFICTRLGKNTLTLASGNRCYCTFIPAMTCCSYVIIFIRITAHAGVGCITAFFTSRSCYCCLIAVALCRNFSCFVVIASFAISLLFALFGAGRFFCGIPFTVLMAERCNVIIDLFVSAITCIRCVALLCASGSCYYLSIIMWACFICITSGAMTNMSLLTGLYAIHLFPIAIIVTKRINLITYVCMLASATSISCEAFGCTCRRSHNGSVAMLYGINVIANVRMTASTCISCVTLFGACRSCYFLRICMTCFCYIITLIRMTACAGVGCIATLFASRSCYL